jgi:glutathione synthase/RimK-type ligase-like ATP-grasp enzyme
VSRVAVATCTGENVDVDSPLLIDALRRVGLDADLCVWDDPAVDWARYDLTVLRSTWDYAPRRDEFLAWARGVERLANPFAVVAYSSDKHYLADLAARGIAVVDTEFCDVGTAPVIPDAASIVVKPAVGAGSIDAARYRRDDEGAIVDHVARLHAKGRDALLQPYVDAVDELGERALIFIDGAFSHAMTKAAMLNTNELDRTALFRREQMSRAEAEPEALAVAEAIFTDPRFTDLLYARVDLVKGATGWAVMELELVEPSLFLTFDDTAADRLSAAIARRLA